MHERTKGAATKPRDRDLHSHRQSKRAAVESKLAKVQSAKAKLASLISRTQPSASQPRIKACFMSAPVANTPRLREVTAGPDRTPDRCMASRKPHRHDPKKRQGFYDDLEHRKVEQILLTSIRHFLYCTYFYTVAAFTLIIQGLKRLVCTTPQAYTVCASTTTRLHAVATREISDSECKVDLHMKIDGREHPLVKEIELAMHQLRPELEHFWCCRDKLKRNTGIRVEKKALSDETSPLPVRAQPTSAAQKFRGRVSLSAGGSSVGTMEALCSFDATHILLEGGANWSKELVKLPLCHVIFSAHQTRPSAFEMKVSCDSTFGCDTRIEVNVASQLKRNRWLSALWECNATIHGWDAATGSCTSKLRAGCFEPSVIWLS